MIDSTAIISNINPGETGTNMSDMFVVTTSAGMIPGMPLKAMLHIYNDIGYEEYIEINIPVGYKTDTDPTGPCDYGYVIFDLNDTEHYQNFTYNWREIRNIGTNTGIIDKSGSTNPGPNPEIMEEGGAVVDLPFTARFYGMDYDEITICSNGWIAFGESEQRDFRNMPLPGPIAPRAMIAAFWTDLATGPGSWPNVAPGFTGVAHPNGIYTYHCEEENAFIIQWERVRYVTAYTPQGTNGIVVGDSVTFQVLIYDPAHHGTTLGDSPIKIQYKRFIPGHLGNNNHPWNHITVGFQDHTALRGLTYVHNNIYTPGSSPLESGSALLITSPPIMHQNPYLRLSEVLFHDRNGNGIIEPGEYVDLGVRLINVGLSPATDISATLTVNSPNIVAINTSTHFPTISFLDQQSNVDYLTIYVNPDTPHDYTTRGILRIVSNHRVWTQQFDIAVKKPNLSFRSFFINDKDGGNNNGALESGETAKLIINLTNQMDVHNINVTISSTDDGLTINEDSFFMPSMSVGNIYQAVFCITVSESITDIKTIPIDLKVTSANAQPIEATIELAINHNPLLLHETFQTWTPSGWSVSGHHNMWSLSQTNNAGGTIPEVRFSGTAYTGSATSETRAITRTMTTTDINIVKLSFRHAANVLPGGVRIGIETRAHGVNRQVVWSQVLTENLSAEVREITINNDHLNREGFQVSFFVDGRIERMTEWFIDDVTIESAYGNTGTLTGHISINDFNHDISELKVRTGNFITFAKPDSNYTLYVLPRRYPNVQVMDPFIEGPQHSNIEIGSGQTMVRNFNLHYRVPPRNLSGTLDENNMVYLTWIHPYSYDTDFINFRHFNVWRQTNSMGFEKVAETQNMYFTETVNPNHRHRYYIVAQYANGVSDRSDIVDPSVVSEFEQVEVPIVFNLAQNFPNPFNPTTNIRFTIPEASNVSVKIYNVRGQLIRELKNEFMDKGTHVIQWHGDNDQGRDVGSGIYFIRVHDGNNNHAIRKSLLLK
jgi:hypothetical protein